MDPDIVNHIARGAAKGFAGFCAGLILLGCGIGAIVSLLIQGCA